jgi:hypothetical protein
MKRMDNKQGLDLSEMIDERTAKKWEWFSTYIEVEGCTSLYFSDSISMSATKPMMIFVFF